MQYLYPGAIMKSLATSVHTVPLPQGTSGMLGDLQSLPQMVPPPLTQVSATWQVMPNPF
jgi:hypothetical protein